jgi:hypothetical protein
MEFGIFLNGYIPGPGAHDTAWEHQRLMREANYAIFADEHNWKYAAPLPDRVQPHVGSRDHHGLRRGADGATSNAGTADKTGVILDDVATAHFRGELGKGSISFFPELEDCYYNSRFLQLVRDHWGAQYARPTLMLFSLCGPHHSGVNAHLDAVNFRGQRIENTPVWLLNIMGRSGLFTEYMVKMAQVITWWYRGENGTFTYWPDGPLREPKRLEHPLWNKGVVVQNEMMFHRGDPVGRPGERDIAGLKNRSLLGYDAERDDWVITTDDEVLRRYRPEEVRLLVHWSAEVYADRQEVETSLDHSDDLTLDTVFDRLLADLRGRGVDVVEPSDPMHDTGFIRTLIANYSIAPTTDWAKEAA